MTTPMNRLTAELREEHRIASELLGHVEEALDRRNPRAAERALLAVYEYLEPHSRKEETIVFPLVAESCPGGKTAVAEFEQDHRKESELLEEFQGEVALDSPAAITLGRRIVAHIRDHMRAEDNVLLTLADFKLGDAEVTSCVAGKTRRRTVAHS